ncbi:WG repeat-containing protein [Chryseobacterium chendengshani]|uniref:WG repeat-containing protein n=1 Tax=Chryseobacterium sp. LJ668 TaxID=2864040 RepID=UPI001C68E98B|nr:WG repeat-containing protein [Chryseobacterium sp. LJ668]MBW8522352.1 WG repeat-containing protein [Chryseobacterium sp. LJ668]QYK17991.1 WG repeat-containing protein [Chryseobacterium sp. LJ668]
MKKVFNVVFILISISFFGQSKTLNNNKLASKKKSPTKSVKVIPQNNSIVLNENVPLLIPQKINENYGYINQNGKFIIAPEYHIAMFFAEDCNLLNSPNAKAKKFGTGQFATVEKNNISYRINKTGKKVYQYKAADLGRCNIEFKKQLFHAYILNGSYGIIEDSKFSDAKNPSHFRIYPKYEYLHILEGDDLSNPMIVASNKDKFGVIDVNNNIIIPFEYADIKRNYSWKLGKMFEVTKDDKNYYYIDTNNKSY